MNDFTTTVEAPIVSIITMTQISEAVVRCNTPMVSISKDKHGFKKTVYGIVTGSTTPITDGWEMEFKTVYSFGGLRKQKMYRFTKWNEGGKGICVSQWVPEEIILNKFFIAHTFYIVTQAMFIN